MLSCTWGRRLTIKFRAYYQYFRRRRWQTRGSKHHRSAGYGGQSGIDDLYDSLLTIQSAKGFKILEQQIREATAALKTLEGQAVAAHEQAAKAQAGEGGSLTAQRLKKRKPRQRFGNFPKSRAESEIEAAGRRRASDDALHSQQSPHDRRGGCGGS